MPALSTPRARGATFDETGAYRYSLWRAWARGPRVAFLLLNPSTADQEVDDPTIRRCTGFARALGFGSMEVVNVCALRSTDPRALARHPDPRGPRNDEAIRGAAARAALLIVGWGNLGAPFAPRAMDALARRELSCFGLTARGCPRHPLYLPATTPLTPYAEGPRSCAAPLTVEPGVQSQAMVPAARRFEIFAESKPIELSTSSVC